jgi:NADH-quinone oxidoreductase subunit M
VILAGVLLKLGTYGIYRFALPMCPGACWDYAPAIAVLSIIGIVYAGLICWVQTDVKKLVAYSSVAHLGFCILGMFAFNVAGLTGSVLYMINHGLSTGALFLMIGMIYERYHTRSMKELGGLASKMPVWATFMVFFTMASVGLPGLNGFVSEFLCIFGTFQAGTFDPPNPGQTAGPLGPWYGFIAGTGMIVAAMYLLYMLGRVVWGMLVEPHGDGHGHGAHEPAHAGPLPRDLSWREITTLLPLAVACLALGVYPRPLLKALEGPTLAEASTVLEGHSRAQAAVSAGTSIAQHTTGGPR